MEREIEFGTLVELQVILERIDEIRRMEGATNISIFNAPNGYMSAKVEFNNRDSYKEYKLVKGSKSDSYHVCAKESELDD